MFALPSSNFHVDTCSATKETPFTDCCKQIQPNVPALHVLQKIVAVALVYFHYCKFLHLSISLQFRFLSVYMLFSLEKCARENRLRVGNPRSRHVLAEFARALRYGLGKWSRVRYDRRRFDVN